MRYEPIPKDFYISNRKNFVSKLKEGSLAIFNSNDQMPTNADGLMPFRQNNDILYLSGIDQEETILVIFPDFPEEANREILFIKETSEEIAIWHGPKFTKEEAREISGINTVHWLSEFPKVFNTMMSQAENVYLNANDHIRAEVIVETRDARFAKWCKSQYPMHNYERSAPIMGYLRGVKSEQEIEVIRKACQITEDGFRRICKMIKPGVMEYEIEAELLHEFVRNRSRGFAYEPIIASGFSACILHYIQNNQECKDGDILLLDVGAEYGNYNADLTRSVPVNGRFTQRQKDVYNSVLHVQREAYKLLVPGNNIQDYHKEVGRIMESELLKLGLLDKTDVKNQDPKRPLYLRYFMHGTSHHLGLDVHDWVNWWRTMEEGMVLTVEPGIYIREESLGVRIENDVVIRKDGIEDLMATIPAEAEEIEELMNS